MVDNSPDGAERELYGRLGFSWLKGVPKPYNGFRDASYHHGLGLNQALEHVQTRFALFLDPDFYIVRREWIKEVTDYMASNNLAFFGAPYHPKWYLKYRYFPCAQCLFLDLEKVSRDTIEFRPEVDIEKAVTEAKKDRPRPASRVKKLLKDLRLKRRRRIGTSRDTGYWIYRRYYKDPNLRYACVLPVFRPEIDGFVPVTTISRLGTLVDRLLPDRLSYTPTRHGYFCREGFREHGYPDFARRNWEEFMWKGLPFGFHLRGYGRAYADYEAELQFLKQFISSLKNPKLAAGARNQFSSL